MEDEEAKFEVKDVKLDIKEIDKKIKKKNSLFINGKRLLHEPDEEYKSCCFECDKEFVLYIGKMTISMSVLCFSFLMLQNPENDVAFYTSTISLLLGHFLNNPISKKEKKDKKE